MKMEILAFQLLCAMRIKCGPLRTHDLCCNAYIRTRKHVLVLSPLFWLTPEAARRPRLDSDAILLNFPAVAVSSELTSSTFCLLLLTTAEATVCNWRFVAAFTRLVAAAAKLPASASSSPISTWEWAMLWRRTSHVDNCTWRRTSWLADMWLPFRTVGCSRIGAPQRAIAQITIDISLEISAPDCV